MAPASAERTEGDIEWERINEGWNTPMEGATMSTVSNAATQSETPAEAPASAKQNLEDVLIRQMEESIDLIEKTDPKAALNLREKLDELKKNRNGESVEQDKPEELETITQPGLFSYERMRQSLLTKAEEWKNDGRLESEQGISARVYTALYSTIQKYCGVDIMKVVDRTIADLTKVQIDIEGKVRRNEGTIARYEKKNERQAKILARLTPEMTKLEDTIQSLKGELDNVEKDHYTAVIAADDAAGGLRYSEKNLRGMLSRFIEAYTKKAREEREISRDYNRDSVILGQSQQSKDILMRDAEDIKELISEMRYYIRQLEDYEANNPAQTNSPARTKMYHEGVQEVFRSGTKALDELKKRASEQLKNESKGLGIEGMLPKPEGGSDVATRDRILSFDQAQYDRFERIRQQREEAGRAAALNYEARTEGPAAA